MRRFAVVLVLGCGPKPEPVTAPVVPVAPVVSSVPIDAAIVVSVDASPAAPAPPPTTPPKSEWVVEVVDYDVFQGPGISMLATAKGPAILAVPGSIARSVWLHRGPRGWANDAAIDGHALGAAIDASGAPWFVSAHNDGLKLRDQAIVDGERHALRSKLAIDAQGGPHVCIATEFSNDGKGKLRYATRKGTKWTVEPLPVPAFDCTIAIASDGAIHIGTETGVISRRGTAWKAESFGGRTVVARGVDGAVVAATRRGPAIAVSREQAGAWQTTPLVDDVKGAIHRFAIAADPRHVHVVFQRRAAGTSRDELLYAVEGTPGLSPIAGHDAMSGLAISVDASGSPHIAYVPLFAQRNNQVLQYARRRGANEPEQTAPAIDVEAMVASCGLLISHDLGIDPPPVEQTIARAMRLCGAFKNARPLSASDLEQRCERKDIDACLIAAVLNGNKTKRTLSMLEHVHKPCGAKRCFSTFQEISELGFLLPKTGSDDARAQRLYQRACDHGHRPACFQIAWLASEEGKSGSAELAKQCPAVPIACAAAIAIADPKNPVVREIRTALEPACKTSGRTTTCGTLAYLEEARLGGAAKPAAALQHHVQACGLGSPSSCTRILVGPLGRPPPPRGLDWRKLDEALAGQCAKRDEDGCLAHASAYERGWVVDRDRDKAKEILNNACDDRMVAACKKLGRKTP